MKPSKRRFETRMTGLLAVAGFRPVPGPRDVPGVTLYWRPYAGLNVLLGLNYHRFYDDTYTADFYLGHTFEFNLLAPGYPPAGMRRISELIPSPGNATHLFGDWWTGFDETQAESLAAVIPAAADKFVAQPGLVDAVAGLPALITERSVVEAVAALAPSIVGDRPADLAMLPSRYPKMIAPNWFWAAERVLVARQGELGYAITARHVENFGIEAWRLSVTRDT